LGAAGHQYRPRQLPLGEGQEQHPRGAAWPVGSAAGLLGPQEAAGAAVGQRRGRRQFGTTGTYAQDSACQTQQSDRGSDHVRDSCTAEQSEGECLLELRGDRGRIHRVEETVTVSVSLYI